MAFEEIHLDNFAKMDEIRQNTKLLQKELKNYEKFLFEMKSNFVAKVALETDYVILTERTLNK